MKKKMNRLSRILLAALLIIGSGGIFTLHHHQPLPNSLVGIAALVLLVGVLWVLQPRQPYILAYEPQSFSSRVLKWVSAPQIEAAVLFWFGMSFLLQPERISIYRLTGSLPVSILLGWVFLLLGYLLLVQMPTPQEYTLIVSIRLVYTLLVAVDVVSRGSPLVIVGAYMGGIAHGILSIALHWHLADLAKEVLLLKRDLVTLEKGA